MTLVARERLRHVGRGLDRVTFPFQNHRQDIPLGPLVIDDEHVAGLHTDTSTRSTGRLMTTSVPSCGRLRTLIRPRCSSTIFFVMASPSPIPSFLVVKYGLKILLRSSSLMPGPVSETLTSTVPLSASACSSRPASAQCC